MKNIAISQRVQKIEEYKEFRDQLDIKLIEFVTQLGFNPIPVPNFKKKNNADLTSLLKWLKIIKPSGIILSGGDDIGKFKYRDQNEIRLLQWSVEKKIPLIGICRGMQLIGQCHNVKLKKIKNHVGTRHYIVSTKKNQKNKKKRKVNSFHNYALSKCPKKFNVIYKSLDGIIESIESRSKKIYACMWHPERESSFKRNDILKFKSFFLK